MLPRRPIYIRQLDQEIGASLARLSAIEGLARSTIIGLIPLVALEALGDKEQVSITYTVGAFLAMLVTLNVGTIERVITRKWTVTMGVGSLIVAAGIFAEGRSSLLPIGIGLQAIASSIFSVALSLYIMDFIAKREITRNESRRMVWNGAAWLIGPSLGIWLWTNVGPRAPFVLSMWLSAVTIAYFWYLRLSDYPVLSPAKSEASNPLRTIPRFFKQKNLRISYVIILVRAVYWVAVFVYGPIYVLEAGLPNWVSGAFLSGIAAMLFFSPVVLRATTQFGVRAIVTAGFGFIAIGCAALALLGEPRPIGLAFWVFGAIGAIAIDIVGNVPFMRLVKPRERVPMTTVFSTWRQVSALLAPTIAFLVLLVMPFRFFYFVVAGLALVAITATSYLPKRLQ